MQSEINKEPANVQEKIVYLDEKGYLSGRLEDQIKWYGKKSATNKTYFRWCQVSQLLMATLITLSGTFNETVYPWRDYTLPLLGAGIAIISGLLGHYKFQENWLEYRTVCESLKHEKFLFLTRSEPYNNKNPLGLLVNKVETLISKENTNWSQYMSKEKDKEQ